MGTNLMTYGTFSIYKAMVTNYTADSTHTVAVNMVAKLTAKGTSSIVKGVFNGLAAGCTYTIGCVAFVLAQSGNIA